MPLHCTMEKTSSDFPSDFPFLEYLLDLVSEKSTICNLDSDGTNFIPPSRNTEQLLQIDVKYVLILITFLYIHTFRYLKSIIITKVFKKLHSYKLHIPYIGDKYFTRATRAIVTAA